jgi:hypothetical protein
MKRSDSDADWSVLQLSAGLLGIFLFGLGLLFSFLPGLHDALLGDDTFRRLGLGWPYRLIFGAIFASAIFVFFRGLRAATRPPGFLYRLTHPRSPRWLSRRRGAWPGS